MTTDRVIVCQNPACRKRKIVRDPWMQRRQKYCSRHCVGVMAGQQHLTPEGRLRGAAASKETRRRQSLARLAGMTPVAIYRKGFENGWHAGQRSAARRYQREIA